MPLRAHLAAGRLAEAGYHPYDCPACHAGWLWSSQCRHSPASPVMSPSSQLTSQGEHLPLLLPGTPGFRAALFPSHKGIRGSARKRLPCYFLSWTNRYIWLLWVSRSPFILLSLWWPHLKLYRESIQKFVFRWEVFPETLLLQGSCPADPHKWTNHVCEIHTKTSCNLKWRLLSAFSTRTHRQLLTAHS